MSVAKQACVLGICLLIHVFLFNLVTVSSTGPQFYWYENLTFKALSVYVVTAILGAVVYVISAYIAKLYKQRTGTVEDNKWFFLSLMVLVILTLLLTF
ncbi:hypothetical protein [Thalassotalea sediminis]|uniref:hypothetical protein n=1 Tax=Thalassotalea sediminis TaxID=1759089 RepID=UPI0025748117|nr:hypothetical protein [Thalassotalea sediminis]